MTIHIPLPPNVAAAHALERGRIAALRRAISDRIEADLDRVDRCLRILDALDGDPDIEPSLGSLETVGNEEIFRGCKYPPGVHTCFRGDQRNWAGGSSDDLELDMSEMDGDAWEWSGEGRHVFWEGQAI